MEVFMNDSKTTRMLMGGFEAPRQESFPLYLCIFPGYM